jgi:hypothetical protein
LRPVRKESSGVITTQQVVAMTTSDSFSADEPAPRCYSLMALLLLTDPISTLLDQHRLVAIANVALRQDQPTTRGELALLRECARDLRRLRPKLKQAMTIAYADGDIDAAATQRLIDRFGLWSD